MSGFLKTFLLITILSVTINIGAANKNDDFNGIPSYTIFTYTDNLVVDSCYIPISYVYCHPDNVSIEIYISGVGNVDANKLSYSIPPYIIDNQIINVSDYYYVANFKSKQRFTPIHPPSFGSNLSKDYFKLDNESKIVLFNFGEEAHGDNAPITLNFTINKSAPAGNYVISTILFYKNGSQWYQSEKNITIHIKEFYETTLFQVGLLAILPVIVKLLRIYWKFLWNLERNIKVKHIVKSIKREQKK